MPEQQLVDYIKKARQMGQQDSQTKVLLSKNGWNDDEINEAVSAAGGEKPTVQEQPLNQPQYQAQTQTQTN